MSDLPNYVSDEESNASENEEYGSPLSPSYSPVEEPVDGVEPKQDSPASLLSAPAFPSALGGDGRISLEGIHGVDLLDFASNAKASIVLVGVPTDQTHRSVFEHCSSVAKIVPQKCEKVNKSTYLIVFANETEAEHASNCKYKYGKVSAGGARLHFFYRVTYYTSCPRSDCENRYISSLAEVVGVEAITANINLLKSCVSFYLQNKKDFVALLENAKANTIHVKGAPGLPAEFFHLVRSCASTNDPSIHKLQLDGIPVNCNELKLLFALREVCDPLIPKDYIFGLSVFRFPDSNKTARFGFIHVEGKENADLLRRIEVPCKGGKIKFFNARNSNNKRARE